MARTFLQYLILTVFLLTVGVVDLQARRFRQLPDSSLTALRAAGRTPLRDTSLRSRGDSSLSFSPDSTGNAIDSTVTVSPDSTGNAKLDSLHRADSIKAARADSVDLLRKSSLERPAFSTAKDSIITDFSDGKRMILAALR